MKSKNELLKEAAGYFKSYPKADEIHTTGDGNFFLKQSDAKFHAGNIKNGKVTTITREETEGTAQKDEKEPVTIPDGVPNKGWTKEELIAYGQREFPDVKLTKNQKEDTILAKLAEAAKAKADAEAANGKES